MTPEDGARQLLSPVQSMMPFSPYATTLSPRLQMASNSPHLGQLLPDIVSTINGPDLQQLSQPPHILLGTFSLTRPHQWSTNSPQHRYHSPLQWGASISPPMFQPDLSHSPPSSHPGDMTFHRELDPLAQDVGITSQPSPSDFELFESFINYRHLSRSSSNVSSDSSIGNMARSFIHEADTYETQKEYHVSCVPSSFLMHELAPLKRPIDECATYIALRTLFTFEDYSRLCFSHPDLFERRDNIISAVLDSL